MKTLQKILLRSIVIILLFSAIPLYAQNTLPDKISSLAKQNGLNDAQIGIEIVATRGQEVIYQKNPCTPLAPASNMKIITTAATLDALGKDFSYVTTLSGLGKMNPAEKTYWGDLYVKGSGDPNFSGRFYNGNPVKIFEDWTQKIKEKGISKIDGNIVLDDTAFDMEFTPAFWTGQDMTKWYTAPVSALSLNDNCIDITINAGAKAGELVKVTVSPQTNYVKIENKCITTTNKNQHNYSFTRNDGSNVITLTGKYYSKAGPVTEYVTIYDPTLFFGTVLKETLEKNGIAVTGKVQRGKANLSPSEPNVTVFAEHRSPLLATLKVTNKRSQNFYAEQLLKTLGFQMKGQGTFKNGIDVENSFLAKAGVDTTGVVIKDGCGLSRQNRLTADAIARSLWFTYFSENRIEFMESLAIAGEDGGSLEKRLSDKYWRVFAKTGYIEGSCCFSGYVVGKSNEVYIFSILVNKFRTGTANVKAFQDGICRLLSEM